MERKVRPNSKTEKRICRRYLKIVGWVFFKICITTDIEQQRMLFFILPYSLEASRSSKTLLLTSTQHMKILEETTETGNVPYLQESPWNTRESGLGLAENWRRGKQDKGAKRESPWPRKMLKPNYRSRPGDQCFKECSLRAIARHPPPPPLGSSVSVSRIKSISLSFQGPIELTFLNSSVPQDLPTALLSVLATKTAAWKSGRFSELSFPNVMMKPHDSNV